MPNVTNLTIETKIFTLRGVQVMIDRDLAVLYGVETRVLKQAVKRNIKRFPHDFMFEADASDIEAMVSQSVIPSKQHLGGAKPFIFSEQGVSTLSSILTSDKAIEIHIEIMRAFVQMRRYISQNALLFERVDLLERKQQTTEQKIDTILNAIEDKSIQPKQGIFFDGQIFDAYIFISDLIKKAKKSITLIDNYIDESTLLHLSSKVNKNIKITILTKTVTKAIKLDIEKNNAQYQNIELKEFKDSHDRFLIIDETVYHIGASLKDLGKKWFAFSRIEGDALHLLEKVQNALVHQGSEK
ncbi:MAG: ORF6N domain-containing protein [Campylobacterota bacterium]|nr:ORF6N domain-containing protein [Campylobacterota bacterium]